MTQAVARSFGLLLRHFFSSFALGALCSAPPLLLVVYAETHDDDNLRVAAALALYIATFYWYAAVMLLVSYDLIGARVAWRQILRRLRGMLAIRLFVTSLLILALVLLSLALVLYLALKHVVHPSWDDPFPQRLLTVLVLLIALMLPLYVSTSCLFALPVMVLEGVSPARGIVRSWQLVRGRRWEIAATYTVAIALYVGGGVLLHSVFERSVAEPSALDVVVGSVAYLAFVPWFIILSVLLYYDLRVRKEFFNLRSLEHQIT